VLNHTFCHIAGIAEKTEQRLWSAGILSWETALQERVLKLPKRILSTWTLQVQESMAHYTNRNPGYFAATLPPRQLWRLYRDFRDSCAFVDIETTGLHSWAEITTITLYDGQSIRTFVNGHNLQDFVGAIQRYALLVTYNGQLFDVPFIERTFGVRLTQAHIDLRYPLHSLGLAGGLKGCERKLGLARPGMDDVDGMVAVLLWQEYKRRNNPKALETLLAYNVRDTIVLHTFMVHTHNEKLKETPFAESHPLPLPSLPNLPFTADRETVERVLRQAGAQPRMVGASGR
jgi:uncharacterized protein